MEIIDILMLFIKEYPSLVSFISAILSEEILLFIAILSGRGILPFYQVFIFGILGVTFIDLIFFYIGRSRLMNPFVKFFNLEESINQIQSKKRIFALFLSKFIYVTRMASIFYLGIHKMSYKKFFIYNFLSVILWAIIMLPIGFLAGKGFNIFLKAVKGFERLSTTILITIILVFIINLIVKKIIKTKMTHKAEIFGITAK